MEIRIAWRGVDASLRNRGPFDIYFQPQHNGPHYATDYMHYVYYNGFLVSFTQCKSQAAMRLFLIELEKSL